MDVQLNFINNSAEADNAQVVIFQKNVKSGFNNQQVAWLVIRNCGQGDNHPFTWPETMQVSTGDSDGNYTPKLDAAPGDAFTVSLDSSGDTLSKSTAPSNFATEVQVANNLAQGSISANIYKDNKLLATKTSVAPNQMAAFKLQPSIWIGTAADVVQGQVMSSAIVDAVNHEISLLGLASADIVMTGGGSGQNSTPIRFVLQNAVYA